MAVIKRITKSGEVRYLTRLKDRRGKQYPARTFERKTDAERHERELQQIRDAGASSTPLQVRKMTVSQYWDTWAARCRSRVSDGWKQSQDQMFHDHIGPRLGEYRLAEVRRQDVLDLLNSCAGKGLSPQTSLHVYNLLHKMFSDAIEDFRIIDENPVARRYRPQLVKIERAFLKSAEAWRLLEAAKGHFIQPAITLALFCGLRPSEVQALRWESVDLERGELLIREAYKRKMRRIEPFPKGKRSAVVPIPRPLLEYLRDIYANQPAEWFVAPGLRGGMLKYELFLESLKRLCRLAGVREVTPHELRHSTSQLWQEAGAGERDMTQLLNQSGAGVTQRYLHRADDRLRLVANRVTGTIPVVRGIQECPKPRLIASSGHIWDTSGRNQPMERHGQDPMPVLSSGNSIVIPKAERCPSG